jgi:hypothetical protein
MPACPLSGPVLVAPKGRLPIGEPAPAAAGRLARATAVKPLLAGAFGRAPAPRRPGVAAAMADPGPPNGPTAVPRLAMVDRVPTGAHLLEETGRGGTPARAAPTDPGATRPRAVPAIGIEPGRVRPGVRVTILPVTRAGKSTTKT